MKSYSVSAIIPAFNCSKTLERAVNSLIDQTLPPDEIIIINNNSSDNTQEIIDILLQQNPSIKTIPESKPGANAARNAGLKIAKGNWIQLLDADDELLHDKLEHQISLLKNNPETDVVYANSIEYKWNTKLNKNEVFKYNYVSDNVIDGIINSTLGRTLANLWLRSSLEKVNYFDESRSSNQEYFLILDLYAANCKFLKDPEVHTKIYVDNDSISRTSDPERSVKMLETRLEYFNDIKTVLEKRNELTPELKNKLNAKINRSYYNNYYLYNDVCSEELLEIKNQYSISPSFFDKIITHAHQVYSLYVPKKGLHKYFIFAFYFFVKLGKLRGEKVIM